MRLIRKSLLLFWNLASLLIPLGAQQPSPSDPPKHIVRGIVVNSVTGSPIARALVTLNSTFSRYAMTDGAGEFRFEGVAEGWAKLGAERPGFFKPTDDSGNLLPDLQVDRELSGIVVNLVPWAAVNVHVHSINGVPIQGYPVRLYQRQIIDGAAQWGNETTVVSSADGLCRIFAVNPGPHVLSGGPERWRPRPPGAKHLGYPLVFYPNVREFSAASMFAVTPGQNVDLELALSQEPLFEISGDVIDVPEAVDAKIELSSIAGDPVVLQQPHPAQHDFSGYASAGTYTLRASAEVNGKPMHATLPLTIGTNINGIHVLLTPQMSVPVNVRTESADRNRDQSASARINLKSRGELSPIDLWATQLENRSPNTMEVKGVEPGKFMVEINPFNSYVKSANSGATDLLENDLVVPQDGNVGPIEIVLSNDGGEVSGNVKLPDSNSSATVLLASEDGPMKVVRTMIAQSGAFTFGQVPPGDYVLLAFDRVKDLEYKNPEALGSYRSMATQVHVSHNQHVTTMLDLIKLEK